MLVADYFVGHQLAVNNIYCALKYAPIPVPQVTFHRWLSFSEPVVPGISLIPDGYVEFMTPTGIVAYFLEVDLGHESQTIWRGKVKAYSQLAVSGKYRQQFGPDQFGVLVIANSERRLHSIRKTVAETTAKLFRFATLAAVGDGFFAPVWYRPKENQPSTLIETQQ